MAASERLTINPEETMVKYLPSGGRTERQATGAKKPTNADPESDDMEADLDVLVTSATITGRDLNVSHRRRFRGRSLDAALVRHLN